MNPPVAIALAYAVVGAGILVYLLRVRRRLRQLEGHLRSEAGGTDRSAPLTAR